MRYTNGEVTFSKKYSDAETSNNTFMDMLEDLLQMFKDPDNSLKSIQDIEDDISGANDEEFAEAMENREELVKISDSKFIKMLRNFRVSDSEAENILGQLLGDFLDAKADDDSVGELSDFLDILVPSVGNAAGIGDFDSGKDFAQKVLDLADFILKNKQAAIFKLAANFISALQHRDKNKFKDSKLGSTTRLRKMRNYSDIQYLRNADLMLPDVILDAKLAMKNLLVEQPEVPEGNDQQLFVLVDTSSSMYNTADISNIVFAKALAISMLRYSFGKNLFCAVQFFNDSVVGSVLTTDRYMDSVSAIAKFSRGGGTNTQRAIKHAVNYIKNSTKKMELAVITDGEDSVNIDKDNGIRTGVVVIGAKKSWDSSTNMEDNYAYVVRAVPSSEKSAIESGLNFIKEL